MAKRFKPSAEQLQQRAEKKARIQSFVRRIAGMSDEERAVFSAKLPTVVTCEGHPLTVRNTMLLYFQSSGPLSVVGGFRQWIKQGRCVRKGEKGMTIFVPCGTSKPDQEPKEAGDVFFVGGTVFDISQTQEITDANEDSTPVQWEPGDEPRAQTDSDERAEHVAQVTGGRTIWNSSGTDGPCLICPPPAPEPRQFQLSN